MSSIPARGLRGLVRLYQLVFSGRPSPCRYYPSCSAYAVEALEIHGAARGSWLTVRRLLRCHPWGGHGVDPVPPSRRVPYAPAPPPGGAPTPRGAVPPFRRAPSAPAPVPN